MDYRLVEFLFSISSDYKLFKGWTKYLARKAAEDLLPQSIAWRKDKKGWPIPEKVWFNGPLRDWMYKKVMSSSFLKRHHFVSEDVDFTSLPLVKKVRLLNMAIWHDVFFEKKSI